MKKNRYVPERGDVIWLNFDPQSGKEQAGHRPALVLSPKSYNETVGLAICCPITSRVKGYPFEVYLPKGNKMEGAVLSDHVKSMDWKMRNARFICKINGTFLYEVTQKLSLLIS